MIAEIRGWPVGDQMVSITKLVKIAPIPAEKPEVTVQGVQFGQVDGQHEDAVFESVAPGGKALMHHAALVEARAPGGFRIGINYRHAVECEIGRITRPREAQLGECAMREPQKSGSA